MDKINTQSDRRQRTDLIDLTFDGTHMGLRTLLPIHRGERVEHILV